MAFRVYCIELAEENQERASAILNKHCVNGDIDVRHLEFSRRGGMDTVQYWLTCTCSEDLEVIANELKENGIEVF